MAVQGTSQPENRIVRKISDYVLIGSDQGLGNIQDIDTVFRMTSSGVVEIGTVQIIKFQNGQTAARILEERAGYEIQPGDFVRGSDSMVSAEANPAQTATAGAVPASTAVKLVFSALVTAIVLLLIFNLKQDVP